MSLTEGFEGPQSICLHGVQKWATETPRKALSLVKNKLGRLLDLTDTSEGYFRQSKGGQHKAGTGILAPRRPCLGSAVLGRVAGPWTRAGFDRGCLFSRDGL